MTECPLPQRYLPLIEWASLGKTTAETAVLVGLAEFTVKAYLRDAREITNAASIASLVAMALRNGWIK